MTKITQSALYLAQGKTIGWRDLTKTKGPAWTGMSEKLCVVCADKFDGRANALYCSTECQTKAAIVRSGDAVRTEEQLLRKRELARAKRAKQAQSKPKPCPQCGRVFLGFRPTCSTTCAQLLIQKFASSLLTPTPKAPTCT